MWLIISKFCVPKGFSGITVFPFVFVCEKQLTHSSTFVNHEKIHIKQQAELLVFFFFIWYGLEFLIRWIQFKNKKTAYRNISFEREAYANENTANYLSTRKLFSFFKYL